MQALKLRVLRDRSQAGRLLPEGADWPDGSYGQRNRQAIAARETG
jgi:hypothetical protein